MKHILFCLFILLCGSFISQENIRISENEVNKETVDVLNAKASKEKNKDTLEYSLSKALMIAEEIEYIEGQTAACKGLIQLHKNDKQIYEKLRFTLQLANIYEKHGTNPQKVFGYNQLGKIYYQEKLYAKAVEQFRKSVSIDGEGKDGSYESQIGLIRSLKKSEEYSEALVSARKLEFNSGLDNSQKIELQKEKAEIYHVLKAYSEELDSYKIILKLIEKDQNPYLEPIIWNNIGYTLKYLGNYSEAKIAFAKAIDGGAVKDYVLIGGAYYNLGLIFYNQDDFSAALLNFEKAQVAYDSLKAYDFVAQCLNMEAMTYYKKNDQYNAFLKVKTALIVEDEHNLANEKARSYEIKSLIHQDLYEYESALEDYKKYLNIRDSLLTEDRLKENKSLYDQYKVEQIEKQFRLIWAKNELDVINIARERAEEEAEKERFNSLIKEDQLRISHLQNSELRAKEELQKLQLSDEKLNRENTERKLALTKRESELRKLALEKELIVSNANKKEIEFLAQKNEFEYQKRKNAASAYETKIRIVAGILIFVFLALVGIMIAYRQLRKRKKLIEQQNVIIQESKSLIEKEKEKSESLLLNILPASIAEELKSNGASKPKLFDEVSVGFTDFSGFTMISEKLSPEELVHKLDEIFYEFDMIIERFGLQRIKTIGDAYMFAGGVPELMEDHAIKMVDAAIALRNYIEKHNHELAENEPVWNIRIGVNTGQIVAGVIGIKKFAYDIWGDAVNIAARMESSGEIGKVNVSGDTFELVKNHFKTEYRGKVKAKNKGEIDMYFVEIK